MNMLLIILEIVVVTYGKKGFGPGEQEWGYVTVRSKAHMFWWLHETSANVSDVTSRPLIIWLQGGPGASSTGYGNLAEIGTLDEILKLRNTTWTKQANLLFIDNPVGTGFSYLEDQSALTTTNDQIGKDLVACLRGFLKEHPRFQKSSLYIASESYGGKMAVEFALQLDNEIKMGTIKTNLRGVSLVAPWISPIDSVLTWAPFLYNLGIVDKSGYEAINTDALKAQQAIDDEKFHTATAAFRQTQSVIFNVTKGVDFFNVLKKIPFNALATQRDAHSKMVEKYNVDDAVEEIMNTRIKPTLNLTRNGTVFNNDVFEALKADFMRPVVNEVEQLLNTTNVRMQIITGQLDLIVDTPGTMHWVEQLELSKNKRWRDAPRDPLVIDKIIEGYKKKTDQFSLYWVIRAGHMVPRDNPIAMELILEDLIKD